MLSPEESVILCASEIFGEIARVVPPSKVSIGISQDDDLVRAILEIVSRHPMSENELLEALHNWKPNEVNENLRLLQSSGKAQVMERYGQRFWSAVSARYSDRDKG